MDLIATATFGLEAIVARELEALGYSAKIIQAGRILFEGDEAAVCRANLWLRTAERVLVRVGDFDALDFGTLFDATYALPWEEWIAADDEFPVSGRAIRSQFTSVPACQKIVKKAIVEKLRAAHRVEQLPESGPKRSIEVALLNNRATLTIDTTGPGLHKRGYRTLVGQAPLKETLAAAMVLLSYWRPERPLVDPFCGSGTIPIEAAMIGRNIAPGLRRSFAAETWPRIAAALWETARQEARDGALPDLPQRILGTDVDEAALRLARIHAEQAGVSEQIHFQRRDFRELSSKGEHGCLICNPPYGERMGQRPEVETLYRAMPDVFRRFKTWSFYVLTAYPGFERLVGQPASRRRKLYNGQIECTYYQFYGPKPGRSIETSSEGRLTAAAEIAATPAPAVTGIDSPPGEADAPRCEPQPSIKPQPNGPAFGGLSAKALEQAELFRRRLEKRIHHLRRWPTKQGITCFRLYERDIPEVPLMVDRYEDYLHIAEFERPHERTPAEHADWLELMQRTAGEICAVPLKNVFLKRCQRQQGDSQHECPGTRPAVATVGEGGLRFEVNLSDYLDVGLFLDQRIIRSMVRGLAAGRRFLNLYAYTGSFTVYAAAGGAVSTTSVDMSNSDLDWAKRNMSLNGFQGVEHQFWQGDVMQFLQGQGHRPRFDLAMLVPPMFSGGKSLDESWDIQRDHAALLHRVLELTTPGGTIFFSTNSRRFKLAEAEIRGAKLVEISKQTVPPDFRNTRIHRCWRLVREA
jgi:23S rRNA (guanine2445-N2)-methyltransferase / 23S rRNA (guanine2069-N7)-methyltransferase